MDKCSYLHRDQSIIHQDLFRKEIGAYRGFVTCAEFLIDLICIFLSNVCSSERI